jgi:glycosyltransferase involved in cell wall biosynthesis
MDSVICQTLREIEIICVDDGSTDNSLEIIKEYQQQDERVRIVTETNAGPALARNNGIRRARGEYLAFLDADDFFEPTLLESLYKLAKQNNLDIAITGYDAYNSRKALFQAIPQSRYKDIYEGGAVTGKHEHPDVIFQSTNGAAWNKIFKREFVIDKGLLFLTEVKIYEDVYFVVTALSLAERIAKLDDILIHHRIYSEQSRARMFRKYYSQIPEIFVQIKEHLMHNGMYAPLLHSFLNMTAEQSYKVYNLLSKDEKAIFWGMLNKTYAEMLGWSNRGRDEFDDADVYDFAANVALYDHETYKKRLSRGESLRLDKVDKQIKNMKDKKRRREFFRSIFGKKKKTNDN